MRTSLLKALADLRVREAQALLAASCPNAAYYLAGYAVEAALKAIIAVRFEQHTVPDLKVVNDFYKHDLKTLLRLANLDKLLEAHRHSDSEFSKNWSIVEGWSVHARYSYSLPRDMLIEYADMSEAESLVNAMTHEKNGVLPWLKLFW